MYSRTSRGASLWFAPVFICFVIFGATFFTLSLLTMLFSVFLTERSTHFVARSPHVARTLRHSRTIVCMLANADQTAR